MPVCQVSALWPQIQRGARIRLGRRATRGGGGESLAEKEAGSNTEGERSGLLLRDDQYSQASS